MEEWVTEFQQNESYRKNRRSNSVILSHEILSWHKYDSNYISLDMLKEMTRQYIEARNPNGLYVAVAHIDQDMHYHVHLVVSGVAYRSGESMRMSKTDFAKLKRRMEGYQRERFPKLAFSQVGHGSGKKYSKENEYQVKRRKQELGSREQLILLVEQAYQQADSLDMFFQLLIEQGIEPYYRNEKLTGVRYGKKKYRLRKIGLSTEKMAALSKGKEAGKNLQKENLAYEPKGI